MATVGSAEVETFHDDSIGALAVTPPAALSCSAMPLSSRHDDPILEQIARDTFALFPHCHRCGKKIERFEDADVRIHVQRVVHRAACPADGGDETQDAERPAGGHRDSGDPAA
jgi:hypothetical protein